MGNEPAGGGRGKLEKLNKCLYLETQLRGVENLMDERGFGKYLGGVGRGIYCDFYEGK